MSTHPNREVRFAVVLYGGVSLAIYMNGISQELLRMVRGSCGLADDDLDPVERIYRELSLAMPDNPGGQTRFLVDIISGTSAGGINGVALAKALVTGCGNLDVLRKAWTDDADIGQLLNDRSLVGRTSRRTASLLDGQHMYDVLLRTIRAMEASPDKTGPLTSMMDLFVTATDLEGREAPIQLTGTTLDERIHKAVFHFAYDQATPGDDDPPRNDFTAGNDPMLAFAARCTSSFPVAFPPMRFDDMPAAVRGGLAGHERLFGGDPCFADRQFADGGYLDNRPFSHAIDLIPFRPTTLPGDRKLLFVDPFPEAPADPQEPRIPPDFDFLQNAKLGAMTLPRREVIRDDLRAITRLNARLDRLATLQSRWKTDRNILGGQGMRFNAPPKPDDVDRCDLEDFVRKGYGETYPLYHHLRVYGTTDTLSALTGHLAGFDPQSDEALYMRQIVRAWRDTHFSAYRTEGKETETAFLSRHDLDFRLRRLVHLRAVTDAQMRGRLSEVLPGLRERIEGELARLRRLGTPAAAMAGQFLTPAQITRLTQVIRARFREVMAATSFDKRYRAARAVYEQAEVRPLVDKAMAGIGTRLRKGFDDSSKRIRDALVEAQLIDLLRVYDGFHWHDVTTLPFLEGSDSAEHSEVQVFRISPADSSLNDSPAKLAGIAVGAFGGFLNRDWREHDILWGRLDGAERIVTALLPDPTQEGQRKDFITRLQNAILLDEYGDGRGRDRRLALLKAKLADKDVGDEVLDDLAARALGVNDPLPMGLERFGSHYKGLKPLGPPAREIADWGSRSASILARMIDDLPATGALKLFGERLSGGLRTGGVLTARFVRFAMPGSFRRLQAERALFLVLLAGLVLVVAAILTGKFPQWIGWLVSAAAASLWTGLYMVGRVLRGRTPLPRFIRGVVILAAVLLMAVGAWTSWTFISSIRVGR